MDDDKEKMKSEYKAEIRLKFVFYLHCAAGLTAIAMEIIKVSDGLRWKEGQTLSALGKLNIFWAVVKKIPWQTCQFRVACFVAGEGFYCGLGFLVSGLAVHLSLTTNRAWRGRFLFSASVASTVLAAWLTATAAAVLTASLIQVSDIGQKLDNELRLITV